MIQSFDKAHLILSRLTQITYDRIFDKNFYGNQEDSERDRVSQPESLCKAIIATSVVCFFMLLII